MRTMVLIGLMIFILAVAQVGYCEDDPVDPLKLYGLEDPLENLFEGETSVMEVQKSTIATPTNMKIKAKRARVEYLSHYNKAVQLQKAGQLDLALSEYTSAVNYGPPRSELYNNIGLIYYRKGDYRNAELNFEQAISLNVKNLNAYNNMGVLAMDMKRDVKAIQCFHHILDNDPANVDAKVNLGILYMRKRNYTRARDQFYEALAIDYRRSSIHYNLGMLFMQHTYYARAKEHLDLFGKYATETEKMRVDEVLREAYHEIKTKSVLFKEDFTTPSNKGESDGKKK